MRYDAAPDSTASEQPASESKVSDPSGESRVASIATAGLGTAANSNHDRLGVLARSLREALDGVSVVVARISEVATPGRSSAPRDFTVVTHAYSGTVPATQVPGGELQPGSLLTSSPFLQAIIASDAPVAFRSNEARDVVAEAYFPGRSELIGARLCADDAMVLGVVIASGDSVAGGAATLTEALGELGHVLSRAIEFGDSDSDPDDSTSSEVDRLHRRLESSEERYRRFIGSTAESIWCLEPPAPLPDEADAETCVQILQDARFVEANVTFARRFGFGSPRDVIGKRVADLPGFWLTEDTQRLYNLSRDAFAARDLRVAEHDPNGQTRILASSLFGASDARGLRSVWAIERDITTQVDEDRLLRESAEFYRAISRTALDGICVMGERLEVLDCNDAFLELLGAGVEPLTDVTEVPILPLDDRIDPETWFENMVESGTWRGDARLRRLSGDDLPVELACRVTDSGPRRYYCFVRDVSERVALEQREAEHNQELAHAARLSTLGEMTSGLAHELNQPLAAIVNYANGCIRLFEQPEFNKEMIGGALRSIVEQSGRAAQIIRRMRSFARRETDKREPVELSDLLKEALDLSSQALSRANVTTRTDFQASIDEVTVDGIQIEQVVLNLIRNAIDAFARSPNLQDRIIEITTQLPPASGSPTGQPQFVQTCIADNGPGIPESSSGHVFDPFFSSGTPGIGLGLTVSRSIIESHNGRLWLEPSPHGARFCFTIPLRNAPISS